MQVYGVPLVARANATYEVSLVARANTWSLIGGKSKCRYMESYWWQEQMQIYGVL